MPDGIFLTTLPEDLAYSRNKVGGFLFQKPIRMEFLRSVMFVYVLVCIVISCILFNYTNTNHWKNPCMWIDSSNSTHPLQGLHTPTRVHKTPHRLRLVGIMPGESMPSGLVRLRDGNKTSKRHKNASKHQKQRMQLKPTASFQVTGLSTLFLPSWLHLEETCETETRQTWLLRLVSLMKPLEVFTYFKPSWVL